jgi:hypothetical protein
MSRSRAADDFATIRARIEALRRERLPEPPAATPSIGAAGQRGPCACGACNAFDLHQGGLSPA